MMPLDVSMYRDWAVQPGTAMTAHGDEDRLPAGAGPFLWPLRGPHARCNSIAALPGSRRDVQPTRAPYPHQIARRPKGGLTSRHALPQREKRDASGRL